MELLHNLTDDQTGILACILLFVGSGMILTISYYVGQMTGKSQQVADTRPLANPQQAATTRRKSRAA